MKITFDAIDSDFLSIPHDDIDYDKINKDWDKYVDSEQSRPQYKREFELVKGSPVMMSTIEIKKQSHDGTDFFELNIDSYHVGQSKHLFKQTISIALEDAELLAKYLLSVVKQHKLNDK